MKTQEAIHTYLASHIGATITAAAAKADIIAQYGELPGLNVWSCFAVSPKAKTICACSICTRNGGFAVNAQNVVDMGASGGVNSDGTLDGVEHVTVSRRTIPPVETLDEQEMRVNAEIEALEARRANVARETALAAIKALPLETLEALLDAATSESLVVSDATVETEVTVAS